MNMEVDKMNSKQKGNIGIGEAIAYFCKLGYTVSIPLNDSQDYDLIVDIDGFLNKVQVKYTTAKAPSGYYYVGLRSISGSTKEEYKTVADTDIDYLFILTQDNVKLLVPIIEITNRSGVTINSEYINKYSV